ncbi:MAG: cytochrome c biogenesis protein CcsA [Pirellulales bacterium]|nr:cytochrome c biogenesis protein CcsA [Pirellulales bacterium]
MRTLLRPAAFPILTALVVVLASPAPAARAAEAFDWSKWEHLPVYHNGRIMPINTYADEAVGVVCGRTSPTLRLKGAVSETEFNSPELASAKTLFPEDQPRKFRDSELVLSWILEPAKWENVPFLIAEHDELRSEILDVPVTNEAGEHLKFVSPAQVAASAGFAERLDEMRNKQIEARSKGERFAFTGVDAKADELFRAYALFRQFQDLGQGGSLNDGVRRQLATPLKEMIASWQKIEPSLGLFLEMGKDTGLGKAVTQANEALLKMGEVYEQPTPSLAEFEAQVVAFRAAAESISRGTAALQQRITSSPPPDWEEDRRKQLEDAMGGLARDTRRLAQQAALVAESLHKNDQSLRVVPALNAQALEKDRDTEDQSQPWLDLKTLVFGSSTALTAYPQGEVQAVRSAFTKLASVFPERVGRPNDFNVALNGFADSLARLGYAIEPLRDKLPIKGRDEDMIRYTAYPAEGYTATEVRYAKQNPFQYSWIVSLLATCCFVVYLIGLRWKWLFWTGVAILAAGLGWASYGFAMRVMITGWAPVTNMYETVIYVPFVVSLLGVWFLLLPMNWRGLQDAWRMTAVPGTWEATPLEKEQAELFAPSTWQWASLVLLLPRIALSVVVFAMLAVLPYAAGGRTVINLLPNVDAGATFPDGNDLLTWFVGWCVLAPTVWYVPRVILAALVSVVMIPLTLKQAGAQQAMDQVYARWPFGLAATAVAFLGACTASFADIPGEDIEPLQPVLRDNFWLLIHVLTIVASYAAGALAWGLGTIALFYYLFGKYREPTSTALSATHRPAGGETVARAVRYRAPAECDALAGYVYKSIQVAVVLLAAGTILGALWADVAWGRFWGWDPKEVWALISFLVYLAILHGRYAGMFGNFGLVVGSALGASAIVMSWYGVNFVLGVGLHSYGFGSGGQLEVFGAMMAYWLALVLPAAVRYRLKTSEHGRFPPPTNAGAARNEAELVSSTRD